MRKLAEYVAFYQWDFTDFPAGVNNLIIFASYDWIKDDDYDYSFQKTLYCPIIQYNRNNNG